MITVLDIDLQNTLNKIQTKAIEINNDNEILETAIESFYNLTKIDTILSKTSIATEDVVKMSNTFTDIIYNKLGYKQNHRISQEDTTIAIALEDIRDSINNIWEAIKQFFIRLWDKIKSFWSKIPETIQKTTDSLEYLEDTIKEIKNKNLQPSSNKFTLDNHQIKFNFIKNKNIASQINEIIHNHIITLELQNTAINNQHDIAKELSNNNPNYNNIIKIFADEYKKINSLYQKFHTKKIYIIPLSNSFSLTIDKSNNNHIKYDLRKLSQINTNIKEIDILSLDEMSKIITELKQYNLEMKKYIIDENLIYKTIDKALETIDAAVKEKTIPQDELDFRLSIIKNIKSNMNVLVSQLPGVQVGLTVNIIYLFKDMLKFYTKESQ